MGIKGSNKSRTVQQGAGTQNIPNSCVLNHCLLITKNKERNRSRPGTQSSPPTSTCHVLQKGAGGVHPLLCLSGTAILAGHSRPTQRRPPHDTQALPLGRKPSLDARPPQGGCATAARPHSPGHGDHSCGPAAEPSPATDWSRASDRKPGRAVHACGTLGRGGHQGLEPGQAL